jgi:hypothetical protein
MRLVRFGFVDKMAVAVSIWMNDASPFVRDDTVPPVSTFSATISVVFFRRL